MRNVLKRLFTNNGDEIIDGAKRGLDALVFTKEEKATMSLEAFRLWIEYQKATQGQNLSRRVIAFISISLWALCVLATSGLAAIAELVTVKGDPVAAVLSVIDQLWVGEVVLTIVVFYFGKHVLTNLTKPKG
jgi:hypothetical protein